MLKFSQRLVMNARSLRLIPPWFPTLSNTQQQEFKRKFQSANSRQIPPWMDKSGKRIKSLDEILFSGKIIYCTDIVDITITCVEILSTINTCTEDVIIGFDAEWPYNKATNVSGKLALIQICVNEDTCYIFHVYNFPELPESFLQLLNHPKVKIVGLNIGNDLWKLGRDFKFQAYHIVSNNTVDVGVLARSIFKFKEYISLQRLVRFLFNKDISKEEVIRRGSWENLDLTEEQKIYAATDAYVSLLCYQELKKQQSESKPKKNPKNKECSP